jgi:hypothetical protein
MISKTCLLISSDPDDHTEFSEAIDDICKDTVLMSVSNSRKALDMLTARLYIPAYIFLDLSAEDLDIDHFLNDIDTTYRSGEIQLIIYGNDQDFQQVKNNKFSDFFNRDSGFTMLKEFLLQIIRQ